MRPRTACMDEVWQSLRASGLLDDEQLRRLAGVWSEPGPVEPRLEQLVAAGVLTGYQAEQIRAGKPGRRRLGPYRILDRLGGGGGGHVYKAEHILMKRLVALKVLGGRRKTRRTELQTAARLSHPHIVAAYDAARWRGRLVLVLEYVEGIDLERLLNEADPLPVALACEVVRQAALALDYLHGRKLVARLSAPFAHRQVSPGRPASPGESSRVAVSGADRTFSTLADAVAAAADGATLTLHGPGPFRTWPLNLEGKALTLRAAAGSRPLVERLDAPGGTWDALLGGDRPLTLEGLDLRAGQGIAPLVSIEGAKVRLLNCSLRGDTSGPLLALRRGQQLDVEDCRLTARSQAIAVEVAERPCRVRLSKSHVEVLDPFAPALLLWSAEWGPPARLPVELDHSTIRAARIVACRSLAGPIELRAASCRFHFQQALVSFDGYRDVNACRGVLRWAGRDNRSTSAGPWMRVAGEPVPLAGESALERWWSAR
jgi:hypothetical protein